MCNESSLFDFEPGITFIGDKAYAAIRSGEEEPPEGLTVERVRLVLRWLSLLSRAYATQVNGVAFAARMTEGQAEARWEALPARFDWAVKAAEDRAAVGEAEVGLVVSGSW